MNKEDTSFGYDEDNSVKYIQSTMSRDLLGQLTEDDIKYLVDLIYEYYEEKGYLNDDADDDIEVDEEDLVKYVFKNAKADNIKAFTIEQIEAVIEGELSYCDSLDDDTEEDE